MEAGEVLHAQDASGVRPHPPHGVERYAEEARGKRQRHVAVQQQRAGACDQQRLWLAPQAQRGPDVFLLDRTVGDQLATRQQVQPGGEPLQPFARERTAGEQARALAAEDAFVGLVGETGVHRQRGVGRRLLDESQRLASAAGLPLHLAAPAGHLESQALAARTGLPLDAL